MVESPVSWNIEGFRLPLKNLEIMKKIRLILLLLKGATELVKTVTNLIKRKKSQKNGRKNRN